MTNSSISLPTWRDEPRMMAPTAWSAVRPPSLKATGLRNASNRSMLFSVTSSAAVRATSSLSMEWPKRYTVWANSAEMAGLISVW